MARRIENLPALGALIGEEIAIGPWRRITQADIDGFAHATGDSQWIHIDPERAARHSPFRSTIAHGFLTLSLLPRLMSEAIDVGGLRMAINYGLDKVRLPAPVPVESRVRARFVLDALEPAGNAFQATWICTVEREGSDKPVCVAEWLVRYVPEKAESA